MLPDQDSNRNSWFHGKRLALLIAGVILLIVSVRFLLPVVIVVFVSQPVRVQGQAMSPTLNDGDRILISKSVGEIKRGDIVVLLYPQDTSKSYIKRIIGMPGEEIEIREGKVLINGNALEEPYLNPDFLSQDSMPPLKIAENHYFVLGDNRRNSSDSRYWGTVAQELIYGQYTWRYWPLE
jgi:signal peptidase I